MEPVPSLYRLIRLYRLVLPLAIVLVVVLFEISLEPYQGQPVAFWLRLGFYGLVGPLVTWMTLEWIAQQVQDRERAQRALEAANRRLEAIGSILKRASAADNLEQALAAVVQEVAKALGMGAALTLEGVRATSPGFEPGSDALYTLPLPGLEGKLEVVPPRPLSNEERAFLEVLAAEVAGALESARTRSRDLLTLYEVDQALRAEANLGRLLERLMDRILAWAGATGGGVLLLDEENFLQPQVLRNLELPPHAFMPDHRWKEALESPVFVRENLLAVPLREQSAIGLLLVQGEAENLRQRLPFLRFLAAQVTLAVRNAQAYLRAEELALTEERNRIAREIHDGIAQALAFMALKLDLSERLLQTDPERALQELHQVKETLRAQIREVRRSIFALRPIDLERYGFLESVRRYATAFAEQAGFRVRLSLPEKIELSQASELVFFRVLQEALTNAAKHARPTLVQVRLTPLGERGGVLEISDNGRGFQAGASAGGLGGFGLTQMRERVEARGGRFEVVSVQGQGTSVRAELPF
ncbi:sensor histidine kinase [Meiothermus taiwanensis]|uniref:Signal transduction histidine-protein kinase/phosphatase DegS n=1 Tax=Meiothermus taiwanensis TaxID=172827 RepID=A0A399E045_9DEIN|nr:sensor histidine kinase [Meiothermus taiwanensis]RIH77957.1 Signal transduction histidine-protein kinase/phosphatase DegS [Meiothermus taiwanensis]